MMYIHYCRNCSRIHMLNGHKTTCPGCEGPLAELAVSFLDFTNMSAEEREDYRQRCRDEEQLAVLCKSYR